MSRTDPTPMDATPGAHSFLDAQAVVSFALACGCRTRPGDPKRDAIEAHLTKCAGSTYPCSQHGEQIITRATQRLVGWRP